ncbi:MAG: hypothetical protein ABI410_13230 [Rhodoferax sp.]|uniref:hypothetical protein n=1 Tax=Rhodoferax sp. TaxID=50421 RepID=UPI0032660B05
MNWIASGLIFTTALLGLNAYAKEEVTPTDWKTECVGRYQISVPGDVEVATQSKRYFLKGGIRPSGVTFNNGDSASRSDFFALGSIEVSPVLEASEYAKYKSEELNFKNPQMKLVTTRHPTGEGFNRDWTRGISATLFEAGRIYKMKAPMADEDPLPYRTNVKAARDAFIKNLATRKTFELPSPTDICFPFGYIKGDGKEFRMIGVAMRLLDHPDVEIFFKDMEARNQEDSVASQFRGSRGQVEFFWSYYGPTLGNKLDGVLDHYRSIKLGGYTGQYAFATIARPVPGNDGDEEREESDSERKARIKKDIADGNVPLDYGFMAYYQGDETKVKTNEPNLMLYVIRTASRAVAAGKQPVTEAELKAMAFQIAASIKRRTD